LSTENENAGVRSPLKDLDIGDKIVEENNSCNSSNDEPIQLWLK